MNFCLLVTVNKLPKSTAPHLTPLNLLDTWASYSMNTLPFLTRSHMSPNLAITIFASFPTSIPKQLPPSPLPLFTASLASLLQLSITTCSSLRWSDHLASTDPELSCTFCCQISQIQSHLSHPSVSALVKDNWAQNKLLSLRPTCKVLTTT